MKGLIIDYSVGNLFSLECALKRLNVKPIISQSLEKIKDCDFVILPGVGSFDAAMRRLSNEKKLLISELNSGLSCLGICLGMQLFFEKSEEGVMKGLSIMRGKVLRLPSNVKVPQMGWNTLEIAKESRLLNGIGKNAWVYFVHSYYPDVNEDCVIAYTDYSIKFPSVVEKNNVFGTQFHPEKSGKVGAKILENFVSLCKR